MKTASTLVLLILIFCMGYIVQPAWSTALLTMILLLTIVEERYGRLMSELVSKQRLMHISLISGGILLIIWLRIMPIHATTGNFLVAYLAWMALFICVLATVFGAIAALTDE